MMYYVLMLCIVSTDGVGCTTHEFRNEGACVFAGNIATTLDNRGRIKFACVPKQ